MVMDLVRCSNPHRRRIPYQSIRSSSSSLTTLSLKEKRNYGSNESIGTYRYWCHPCRHVEELARDELHPWYHCWYLEDWSERDAWTNLVNLNLMAIGVLLIAFCALVWAAKEIF
jgi:hypothetical protein